MKAAVYMADRFEALGVTQVFFVPTILSHTLAEIERRTGIQRIVTHGEKAAAYMADGYARASGRVGVCMAQCIGASNLAAGLRDPFMGGSPVLAITGGPYGSSRERHTYQEIDDSLTFKPVTKWSTHLDDVHRLPATLAQLWRTATAGAPGPVHLSVRGHFGECEQEDIGDPRAPAPEVVARPRADESSVRAVLDALRAAERPVIVAGGGVRASGAEAELRALAERLAIPVATALNAKDILPADHPLNVGVPGLYSRQSANAVLLEADLVFFVGSRTGSQVTFRWQVPPLATPVAQLDIDPAEMGRHYPCRAGMVADAKAGLRQLLDAAPRVADRPWLARVRDLASQWRERWTPAMESEAVPMRPERLLAELNRYLPADALVACDTGHAGMWCATFLDLKAGQRFIRAAGSMGWALPAAIGAQLACPERPVICFTGDGGFWYHVAELETAVRWKAGVVFVVNNNGCMNQERDIYADAYGGTLSGRHAELWHFHDVDFARLAETMGAAGARVTKAAEFSDALARALAAKRPFVLDVRTAPDVVAPLAWNGRERAAVRSTL